MAPKIKKEKVIFLLNVGMKKSLLDKAKHVVRRKMEKMIFLKPEGEVAVILMNSGNTKNELYADHIEEFMEFQNPTWACIKNIINLESKDYQCNWVEALEAAIQYAIKQNEDEKDIYEKKIMLMSDFNEDEDVMSQFDAKVIADRLSDHEIELIALTEESLVNDKPLKSPSTSEVLLKQVKARCITYDNAISILRYHIPEATRAQPSYHTLELVDIKIPIACYVKITNSKIPKLEKVEEDKKMKLEVDHVDKTRSTYTKEDIVEGFKYGGSFIPVEKELQNKMSYKSGGKSYAVHSFINKDRIDLEYFYDSGSHVILPAKEEHVIVEQFYSLVQAMHNTNSVAIVRKVHSANCAPRMVALIPCMDVPGEPWCLIEIQLVFKEDRRVIEPRSIKPNVRQLSDEQNEALDSLINSLTLRDDEDSCEVDGSEQLLQGFVPNPEAQYMYHVISSRALDPSKPLQSMDDYLKEIGMLSIKEKHCSDLKTVSQVFRLNEEKKSKSNTEKEKEEAVGKDTEPNSNKVVEINKSVESHMETPIPKADVDADMDADLDELVADI